MLLHCCVVLTFIYVRGQTSHKHLAGEALDAFPVLVGVTVGGAKDSWDTLVAVAIIEEIVINREEGGAAWWRKKAVKSTANVRPSTHKKHTSRNSNHKHVSEPSQVKVSASALWNPLWNAMTRTNPEDRLPNVSAFTEVVETCALL